MHTEGKAYRDQLPNLYMLEDDYNDNSTHFTIAAERLRVNSGNIREKINDLYIKIGSSHVYEYSSYIDPDYNSSSKKTTPKDEIDIETVNQFINFFTHDLSSNKSIP